jgi:threonine dehydratase
MTTLNSPTLEAIQSARQRLAGTIVYTPLVRLVERSEPLGEHSRNASSSVQPPLDYELRNKRSVLRSGTPEIYLKFENLQPTGSFKVRGAGNALLSAEPSKLKNGVWTASAGNMGQALAWYAGKLGVACTVIVPDDAPEVKVKAIERLGAQIVKVPFAEYQFIQREGGHPGMRGLFIHPFADEAVMAGNGTIGLEILEDLPDVDSILVPYGGGGLSCGIAAAIRASRPGVRVEAAEVATAAPLTGSLAAGEPVEVPYQSSFVSGMGAPFVFPQMWPLASQLLDGSRMVEPAQVADAICLLAERHHIIAEGAGAVALSAALAEPKGKKVVCVVSGGNIAPGHLTKILQGELP